MQAAACAGCSAAKTDQELLDCQVLGGSLRLGSATQGSQQQHHFLVLPRTATPWGHMGKVARAGQGRRGRACVRSHGLANKAARAEASVTSRARCPEKAAPALAAPPLLVTGACCRARLATLRPRQPIWPEEEGGNKTRPPRAAVVCHKCCCCLRAAARLAVAARTCVVTPPVFACRSSQADASKGSLGCLLSQCSWWHQAEGGGGSNMGWTGRWAVRLTPLAL